jgi:hypothetical protein
MKSPAPQKNEPHGNGQARPVRHARQRHLTWRFRPARRLTLDRGPFDPGFGQPAASR